MNKMQFKSKFIFILIFFIIFIFLFPQKQSQGYEIHYQDEGPDVSDTSTTWHFTYYSDGDGGLAHINPLTGTGFEQSDWNINETYGWHEWTYKGTTYVVMAAATLEGLDELPNPTYPFIDRQDYIHYFHYGTANNNWNYSTFQFQFVDNGDDTIYNGIVLDTCELALDPSDPNWDSLGYGSKPENTQWLDVHVPIGYPDRDKYNKFNGKQITLTSTGIFTSGTTRSNSTSMKNVLVNFFVRGIILAADVIQMWLEDVTTDSESIQITYSASSIMENEELQNKVQVSKNEDDSFEDERIIKEINVPNHIDNKFGKSEIVYTESTEIPVIQVDIYNASINNIDLFDIDFYTKANDNSDGFWQSIRNIVLGFSHIVLYLSSILIFVMLIYRSILLVGSTMNDNPQGARESKEIMDGLVKAVIIIAIIYLFMTLMTYFYQEMLTLLLNDNESIFLIRINVEDTYSFNTNFIGYLKYMTLKSSNITFGSAIVYFLGTFANAVWSGFMFIRMIIIAFLTIVAPMTAVTAMLKTTPRRGTHIENILYFKRWASVYMKWLWLPMIIGVILYRFILYIS